MHDINKYARKSSICVTLQLYVFSVRKSLRVSIWKIDPIGKIFLVKQLMKIHNAMDCRIQNLEHKL